MPSGLSRVTVVAPRMRVDLALPTDVPLADLLPTVLRYAGTDLADEQSARDGWTLARLGGRSLDISSTPAQLEVRDGELLYLRPRGQEAPTVVFDDVVDAVATATRDRSGRWNAATTRVVGLAFAVLALLGGAALALLAGPPHVPGASAALGLTVALLVVAVLLARVAGDVAGATTFAFVAAVYAAVGGLLVLAGDRPVGELSAPHVLCAATAVMLTVAAASIGVARSAPAFLFGGICAGGVFLACVICLLFDATPAGAAALTVSLALVLLPLLPMFAYRLGRLPVPTVPTDRAALTQDAETVDGADVLRRADRADGYLGALLGALAAVTGGAAVVVASDGVGGLALCSVLGLLLLARARWFISRVQRLPLIAGGGVAVGAALVAAFTAVDATTRLTAILGTLLVVAAVSVGFVLAGGRRPSSPIWGRVVDIVEVVLIVAVIPLVLWVSGLYAWIRSVRG
ncbi:type VII secretion integral membrane protein EccD [Virgisporangium ochraceum]|uniref:Type VII secretion integral membrane protein EccD n=1 Tax=Virgisporangium ochraceum TaxID=65505 RepID=A0A8J3ZTM6_9ACTN|nr:type VII secretion integral membrane protein EccD [Virgisporangium ochraceum]GIJ68190.1 type VII secretion integral membrane protein EccD [Virgisporangium ochraceum]